MFALLILTCLFSIATFTNTACGITGNFKPDSTSSVGVVVLFSDSDRAQPLGYCSGVLISPTIMLTAGHSTLRAVSASVCFDKGPIDYSIVDSKIVYSGSEPIYTGTPVTYPEYANNIKAGLNKGNHQFSISDLGLIILDIPVNGIDEFSKLPTAGLADTLASKTNLREIGYGVQFQVTPRDNGVQNSWLGTISCNSALAQLITGNFVGSG